MRASAIGFIGLTLLWIPESFCAAAADTAPQSDLTFDDPVSCWTIAQSLEVRMSELDAQRQSLEAKASIMRASQLAEVRKDFDALRTILQSLSQVLAGHASQLATHQSAVDDVAALAGEVGQILKHLDESPADDAAASTALYESVVNRTWSILRGLAPNRDLQKQLRNIEMSLNDDTIRSKANVEAEDADLGRVNLLLSEYNANAITFQNDAAKYERTCGLSQSRP